MEKIGEVTLYDSIENLPQIRKHLFDKFIIMDSGMGGDARAIEESFVKLDNFIAAKDFDKILQERRNLHFKFINGINETNFKSLSFICLVKRIKDKEIKIIDEGTAEEVQKEVLELVSHEELSNFIEEVKKNFLKNLGYIFQNSTPTMRNSNTSES